MLEFHLLRNLSPQIFLGVCIVTLFSLCGQSTPQSQQERLLRQSQKDTCNNADADIHCSFLNMPANVSNILTIAKANEPGEPLVITGTIYKADGKTPYPNMILYVYHTDHNGTYSKKGNETGIQKWHGYLHGWLKTNKTGYYEIRSIRPVRYPGNTIMAHIHAAVKPDDGPAFYINDFVFKDDPLVNEEYLSKLINIGGSGVVDVKKEGKIWKGKRDIILQ